MRPPSHTRSPARKPSDAQKARTVEGRVVTPSSAARSRTSNIQPPTSRSQYELRLTSTRLRATHRSATSGWHTRHQLVIALVRRDLRDVRAAARAASFARAPLAVHLQVVAPLLVVQLLAEVLPQDRDRPLQRRADRAIERADLVVRQRRALAEGVDARFEEDLVRVRVADAGDELQVREDVLDRALCLRMRARNSSSLIASASGPISSNCGMFGTSSTWT